MHKDHPIVVLISAEQEWRPVLEHYHPAILETTPYGECFEVRASLDQPLIFLHGGWGKIKAAGSAQYAISRWDPKLVINLGTCGGFDGMVKRGEAYDNIGLFMERAGEVMEDLLRLLPAWVEQCR